MLVKASGKRLRDVSAPDYFYEVGIEKGNYVEVSPNQTGKPSIEVFLHALLPQKYVIHLHSTLGVAVSLCAAVDDRFSAKIAEQGISIVGYKRPGIELKESIDKLSKQNGSNAFLLQNHGVVFGSDSIEGLFSQVSEFETLAEDLLGTNRNALISPKHLGQEVSNDYADHILWQMATNWRISPDHVVFLGDLPPRMIAERLQSETSLAGLLEALREDPKSLSPRGEQFLWYLNVVSLLPRLELPTLSQEEAQALMSWEAEKHRVQQSKSSVMGI
jgi:ribulose-5-phosphate 4-epimerase/fuculose-1-phosphate aldolase